MEVESSLAESFNWVKQSSHVRRWTFTEEQLKKELELKFSDPSLKALLERVERDNIDYEEKAKLFKLLQVIRQHGKMFIKVEVKIAPLIGFLREWQSTAVALYKRFYLKKNITMIEPNNLGLFCLNFAVKIEEEKTMIRIPHISRGPLTDGDMERMVLEAISFDIVILNPYPVIEWCARLFKCSTEEEESIFRTYPVFYFDQIYFRKSPIELALSLVVFFIEEKRGSDRLETAQKICEGVSQGAKKAEEFLDKNSETFVFLKGIPGLFENTPDQLSQVLAPQKNNKSMLIKTILKNEGTIMLQKRTSALSGENLKGAMLRRSPYINENFLSFYSLNDLPEMGKEEFKLARVSVKRKSCKPNRLSVSSHHFFIPGLLEKTKKKLYEAGSLPGFRGPSEPEAMLIETSSQEAPIVLKGQTSISSYFTKKPSEPQMNN